MLKFPRDTISCVRMLRHLARRFFRWITFPQQHLLITGWRFRETSKRRRSFNRALTVAFGLTAVVRQIFVSVCCLALSSRSQQKIRSFGSECRLSPAPDVRCDHYECLSCGPSGLMQISKSDCTQCLTRQLIQRQSLLYSALQ